MLRIISSFHLFWTALTSWKIILISFCYLSISLSLVDSSLLQIRSGRLCIQLIIWKLLSGLRSSNFEGLQVERGNNVIYIPNYQLHFNFPRLKISSVDASLWFSIIFSSSSLKKYDVEFCNSSYVTWIIFRFTKLWFRAASPHRSSL